MRALGGFVEIDEMEAHMHRQGAYLFGLAYRPDVSDPRAIRLKSDHQIEVLLAFYL